MLGRLRQMLQRASTFTEVDAEILGQQPIGARIEWQAGGAHAVVITGVGDSGNMMLTVQDPWSGKSQVSHTVFCNAYLGSGRWTRTWLTQ